MGGGRSQQHGGRSVIIPYRTVQDGLRLEISLEQQHECTGARLWQAMPVLFGA